MWKLIATTAVAVGVGVLPALSDPITEDDYFTPHAQGCMLLGECTDDVDEVTSLLDVSSNYPEPERFTHLSSEFNLMLSSLNQVGSKVFIADQKYFPVGHRGVYHTVTNNFFLNKAYMHRPSVLMSVMRHEGWHAAQDCMAGSIDNSMIAIIKPEESIPQLWQDMVEATYPEHAWPWEKEATWAGKTPGVTQAALQACARGKMWEVYPPTPLTREWLEENKYIVK